MRAVIIISHLLVLLLGYGNSLISETHHSPLRSFSSRAVEIPHLGAYITNTGVLDSVEDGFPDLIVENITEGNDDDNNDDNYSEKEGCSFQCPLNFSTLFAASYLASVDLSSRSLAGSATPLYLSNRVFRI